MAISPAARSWACCGFEAGDLAADQAQGGLQALGGWQLHRPPQQRLQLVTRGISGLVGDEPQDSQGPGFQDLGRVDKKTSPWRIPGPIFEAPGARFFVNSAQNFPGARFFVNFV